MEETSFINPLEQIPLEELFASNLMGLDSDLGSYKAPDLSLAQLEPLEETELDSLPNSGNLLSAQAAPAEPITNKELEALYNTAQIAKITGDPSVVRVNVGGPTITDREGKTWAADPGIIDDGQKYASLIQVSGTRDSYLYQTGRQGQQLNALFALPDGRYTVNLGYTMSYDNPGNAFEVGSNGSSQGQANSDGLADAALNKSFAANTQDGFLDIRLNGIGNGLARVSTIEIVPFEPGSPGNGGNSDNNSNSGNNGNNGNGNGGNPSASQSSTEELVVGLALAAASTTDIRLNAGGGSYTDGEGQLWQADTYFTAGKTFSTSAAIEGTGDDPLYKTERWGTTFGYDIPVENGAYTVNLHFAEIYFSDTGQRIFDVEAEGQLVNDNLDVFSAAGASNQALVTSLAGIEVADGILDLDFSGIVQNAKLSAIEILGTPSSDAIAPQASLNVSNIAFSGGSDHSFTVTYTDNEVVDRSTLDGSDILVSGPNGFSQAATLASAKLDSDGTPLEATYKIDAPGGSWDSADNGTYTIDLQTDQVSDTSGNFALGGQLGSFSVDTAPPLPTEERVNAGGGAFTGVEGKLWEQDQFFNGGNTYSISSSTEIANTFNDPLYQSERWGKSLSYAIPVNEAGVYEVNLGFAEVYWNGPGLRVFDVTVEGELIADDLDIWSEVGPNTALDITTFAGVTDGVLNVEMNASVNNAKISSIEVLKDEDAHGGHPFLHVVIDAPEYAVDYNGSGSETVTMLGNESHTHEPGQVLTAWTWAEDGTVLGTTPDIETSLSLGSHEVSLTIEDSNDPPETLTNSTQLEVYPLNAVGGVLAEYDLGGEINNLTAPEFKEVIPSLSLQEDGASGSLGGSPFAADNVAIALKGNFEVATGGNYEFSVNGGTDSDVYIDGNLVTGAIALTAGETRALEVRVARSATEVNPIEVLVSIDGAPPVPIAATSLAHDQTSLAPFINNLSRTTGSSLGGDSVTIDGLAFWEGDASNLVEVNWGGAVLTEADGVQVQQGEITLLTPPGAIDSTVPVTVTTPNGTSNTVNFTYDNSLPPVKFLPEEIVAQSITSPTQATWGPDGRLYVGTLNGEIWIYTLDEDYNLTDSQQISTLSGLTNNNILGIAFNPLDDPAGPLKLYVAHNELFANGGAEIPEGEFSPYSGQVSVLEGPDFSSFTPLISGLPVSNHDHGVNGLSFDNNGDLLIAVGGNTNAGVEDPNIGDLPESPLSAAILKADLSKADFNGMVEYELTPGETAPSGFDPANQVYGDIVSVVSGVDLSVYSPGLRNPFDTVYTTSGLLYGTDNGPNGGFGAASTGPDTEGPDPSAPDEFNLLSQGNYYGHPNRNRGRFDERQNVYYGPDATGNFTPPLTTVNPSTNGIDEYRAATFGGQLQGNLIAQDWNGVVHNAFLSPDGTAIDNLEAIPNAPTALDILHGPGGALVGIDLSDNQIVISKPDDAGATVAMLAYDIFPWRAPAIGGSQFTIGGANFGTLDDTTVTIGGQTAVLTSVSSQRIEGVIPEQPSPTGELVDLVIDSNGQTVTLTNAFLYLDASPPPASPGSLAFSAPEFSVDEDGTAVAAILVTRVGGSIGDVSATVTPSDGTATGGIDYLGDPVAVNFADGDSADKVVTIPILEDTEIEGDETVNLTLSDPTGGATLGTQNTATLTILDNDSLSTTSASAVFEIDPSGDLNASTFGSGSFAISNTSLDAQDINRVSIDLSSALFPDLVFDPDGTAGDTTAKDFTVDSDPGVGLSASNFLNPRDNGFDTLELLFDDFNPGETLTFSVDVDPTSIQGMPAPGPGESGSVSGLELVGTSIEVDFNDSFTLIGETYRIPDSLKGSQVTLQSDMTVAPTIEALGISSTPTSVSDANQTIRVRGPAGAEVKLLLVEGALFTDNGNGFDLDPFEANSAVAVTEQFAILDSTGVVDIPVTLTKSDPEGGVNYLVATILTPDGSTSLLSPAIVLELLA